MVVLLTMHPATDFFSVGEGIRVWIRENAAGSFGGEVFVLKDTLPEEIWRASTPMIENVHFFLIYICSCRLLRLSYIASFCVILLKIFF